MSAASPNFATAVWLLEDSCFSHQNLCHGITHVSGGPPAEANAYHAELQGLHALLLAIIGLCSFMVTSGFVTVGCNNVGASIKLNRSRSSPHAALPMPISSGPSAGSVDLSWESPFHFKHVKGHQDVLHSVSSLPHMTKLNILADQLAKHSLLCLLQHFPAQGLAF